MARGVNLQELSPEYLGNLLSRIENKYSIKKNGCWEWTGLRATYGYGRIKVKGKLLLAHRTYYQLIKGWVSNDLVVSHECDNPPCINPDHLKATTQWENNARGVGPSAQNLRKTQCVNGHGFTAENTILGKNRRSCRTCKLASNSRRDAERTKEYNAKGLNSKGRPLKRVMPSWHANLGRPYGWVGKAR